MGEDHEGRSRNFVWRKTLPRPTVTARVTPHPRWPTNRSESPRVGKGQFPPKILPYRRRASLELSEAIPALCAFGMSTPAISRFLAGLHDAFYSPQSIYRLTQVVEEEVRWAGTSPDWRISTACSWVDRTFTSAEERGQRSW